MRNISFHKMHALGNDFMVINHLHPTFAIHQLNIPQLAHRHTGIGFDQLLLIESAQQADFSCRFFNADGSEAEQCGNGVRCVARFLHEEQLLLKNSLTLDTKAGIIAIDIENYDAIRVNMGKPIVNATPQLVTLHEKTFSLQPISMGNPHAILSVPSIDQIEIADWGRALSTHALFPAGVNVGFVEKINPQHIRLRTYERGVGETYACGSNACAAVVAGIANHQLDPKVIVELALGNLQIEWQGQHAPVYMTGPASRVFNGTLSSSAYLFK